MKKILITAHFFCLFVACSGILQATSVHAFSKLVFFDANPGFHYKIIAAPGNTWGYDIYNNDKLFIHQPSQPGMPGNGGFSSKKSAEKVAQLVIRKIKKGEMPPAISAEELRALNLEK